MDFKYKEIPPFTKRMGDALLFDQDGRLEYYIPDDYFEGKSATIEGSYVRLMGSFNYRIYDKNDNPGKLMAFNFVTMFVCRPGKIDTKKKLKLDTDYEPEEYRILTFYKGDQLITRVHTEQNIDNVSELYRLHLMTGNVPNTIPYNELYLFPYDCMELNGGKYNVHSQAMGLLYSKICRDPNDVNVPFRLSKAIDESMINYKPISIKRAAKLISPFTAITSENIDEAIMSAVIMSDNEESGKSKHKNSPLERILTM